MPCDPEAETARQPMIWCSDSLSSREPSSPEECHFRRHVDSHCVTRAYDPGAANAMAAPIDGKHQSSSSRQTWQTRWMRWMRTSCALRRCRCVASVASCCEDLRARVASEDVDPEQGRHQSVRTTQKRAGRDPHPVYQRGPIRLYYGSL